MSKPIIEVENVSKVYRLGQVGATSFRDELERYFLERKMRKTARAAALRGEPHPDTTNDPKEYWALSDVSFKVMPGEVIGVIGKNGAGKSTLLKILSRITEPTSGRITMRGSFASLLEVGTGFHPELTGRENVYLNGAILGMDRREVGKKFDEIVAFSGIDRHIDTPVKRYSTGMRVRLGFAVAAHMEPDILIVDEVLAVGDFDFQKKCLGKMQDVAGQGRTVFFVSHNMASIQQLCPRAILLMKGQVVADGPSKDVIQGYLGDMQEKAVDAFRADNPHRSGSGDLIFTGARLLDENHMQTNDVMAGNSISIEFDYENSGNVQDPSFVFTTYNSDGVPVTSINNGLQAFSLKDLGSSGQIRCRIPRCPLPPGRYRIAVSLHSDSRKTDHISNALFFDVSSSCFYKTSNTPHDGFCCVMLDHSWELDPKPGVKGVVNSNHTEIR